MIIKYLQLSRNIRRLREDRSLTQRDVARMTHESMDTITDIEANRVRPSIEQLIALSLAFDVTVDEILRDVY